MNNTHWDLFSVGDLSVDTYISVPYFPGADQKAIGELIGVYGGGMAANFAAAASAAGARTLYMTRYGSDPDGSRVIDELTTIGVDCSPSRKVQGARTFQCYVQLDATGEKALIGANTNVKVPAVDEVDVELLQAARYVYILADDIPWAHQLADTAIKAGARVVVDLERSAFDHGVGAALALASKASIVFSNTRAAGITGGGDLPSLARLIADQGPDITVVTDGARGALAIQDGAEWFQPGLQTQVKDSTGAGDAHNGTFLGNLLADASVQDALAAAAQAGSRCIKHMGSRTYLFADRPAREIPDPQPKEEVPQ